ncbi:hypothetical protein [Ancylothrix sp. D3o]|uniref:NACHT C-terminal alpha/beta 1 domain-containing protein n=1 Tax=Ancylothrix sp. D3o TaxID=2953691 RepID=UPI0035C8AA92
MKKHHCHKSTEGINNTLIELKIYSSLLLDLEKHSILIFSEKPKPQNFNQNFPGFSHTNDATICIITGTPHPTIPTFSSQDSYLIQTIINCLQRTILEP